MPDGSCGPICRGPGRRAPGFRGACRLADWLTEDIYAGAAMRGGCFLPPGVTRKGFRRLHLNAPWGEIQQRLSHFILPPDEADRLTAGLASLGKGGGDPRKLRLALGPLYQQIGILVKQGYLVWREPWQKKSPAARRVSFVRCGRRPERLTPKQERVWAYLAANDGRAVARAEILAACGVGPAVLGRMVDQGVLLAEEKRVSRVPWRGMARRRTTRLRSTRRRKMRWRGSG